jgi:putative transposase
LRFAGHNEINHPSRKFRLIDHKRLLELLAFDSLDHLRDSYNSWIEEALKSENINRESKWTKSIAVGSEEFVQNTKKELGGRAKGRKVRE